MKRAIRKLFKDKMTVNRWKAVEVNGFTRHKPVTVYEDRLCNLIKKNVATLSDGVVPEISSVYKIITSGAEIHEGDEIIVTQGNGNTINFTAGESFPYSSHIEIDVKRKGTV